MKTIIVQGSSRPNGNTHKIVQILRNHLSSDVIDLSQLDIRQYDYENGNQNDDFMSTIKKIVDYDLILFATPVYWYAMSGTMKTFFDRLTECLKTEKATGRKLRGKHMAAMSCGSDSLEHEGFFIPFEKSAEYLGMHYSGHVHAWIEDNDPSNSVLELIKEFSEKLK